MTTSSFDLPVPSGPTLPTGVEQAATEIRATAWFFQAIADVQFVDHTEIPTGTREILQNTANALAQICRDAAAAQKSLSNLGIEPRKEAQ